jgi:uncharacterized protein YecA (UPF0149 family)
MEYPTINVLQSDEDLLKDLAALRKWYGKHPEPHHVDVVDTQDPNMILVGKQRRIARTSIKELEEAIETGMIAELRDNVSYVIRKGHHRIKKREKAEIPGRNEECVCGSGKKFKRCCIDKY